MSLTRIQSYVMRFLGQIQRKQHPLSLTAAYRKLNASRQLLSGFNTELACNPVEENVVAAVFQHRADVVDVTFSMGIPRDRTAAREILGRITADCLGRRCFQNVTPLSTRDLTLFEQ